jgi:uncharacterized iron-regulated protein
MSSLRSPRPSINRPPRGAVAALTAILLGVVCAFPAAGAGEPPPAAADTRGLGRPLRDLYDTAFVYTDGGRTTARVISVDALAERLADFDVVVYGEFHRHPGVHRMQQRLFRALHGRHAAWVLSLEQFERDTQPVVDDYLAGRIGEITFIDKARAWEDYRTSHRVLVEFARSQRLPVVAAEAPNWAIGCIQKLGPSVLGRFTPEDRALVASELQLGPGAYRDKYLAFQGGSATHGGGDTSEAAKARAERSYAAQAARDDTMAESILAARRAHPGSKVLHLNGTFHSAAFLGTVERLRLRDPSLRIAVITPIDVDDPAKPTLPTKAFADGTALQLVHPVPADFVDGEDQTDWVRKMLAKRQANACKYAPEAPPSAPPAPAPTAPTG